MRAMRYVGFSDVRPNAPVHRVQALVEALTALGYEVHLDTHRGILAFTVPNTLDHWLSTQGMSLLHEDYRDVTGGRCWMHEESEGTPQGIPTARPSSLGR